MDSSQLVSIERRVRLLKTWSVMLATLVLLSLGVNAAWVQAAADPPLRVYTATAQDNGGGGTSFGAYNQIDPSATAESPLTLLSVTTSHLSRDHDHTCLVTASTGVTGENTPTAEIAAAVFGLSIGSDVRLVEATERSANLAEGQTKHWEEVTTTFAFTGVRRDETIRFSARWLSAEGSLDSLSTIRPSMTVVCLRDSI
jgi:hypothetical protein